MQRPLLRRQQPRLWILALRQVHHEFLIMGEKLLRAARDAYRAAALL